MGKGSARVSPMVIEDACGESPPPPGIHHFVARPADIKQDLVGFCRILFTFVYFRGGFLVPGGRWGAPGGALGEPRGRLELSGVPWGSPWGALGDPWGSPGIPWGVPGDSLGVPGGCLGGLWWSLGDPWRRP